ncbi:SDR family NAD(P)-dependent oxidoreductase [Haloactinomyces albus]|uniref:NAD(P)-dependent dehydrogenase (Short-subunit alcohol dehydrogenase family) n=1 Tax=Haloactinomyces albus TaxID=1352928 RepID=A0AAE4CMV7_9ACTN|nr:SDR family oxidoreductase [Haloactinomyces albus]MDR7303835.1 NAD(P)-dependent dehydrogenase (short-subunit alcohol dehydrogenase family) [Haloactinomyces albus]
MNRFDGVSVLLTGAASGIGRATVHRLVAEGAAVFAVDRAADGLAAMAESATGAGRCVPHVADISDEAMVIEAVQAAVTELAGIEVVINVAGIHRTTPIDTLTVEDLNRLFSVNLVGTALVCREASAHLPDRTGVIVNVASAAATQGNPYMTAYAASKGAVLAFSLSLAAEVAGRGIRVVPVSPGTVDTPLTSSSVLPAGRDVSYFARIRSLLGSATPEQVASTIAFAASADGGYVTGAEIRVDGGSGA